jgi:transcription initiation factor TFIIB
MLSNKYTGYSTKANLSAYENYLFRHNKLKLTDKLNPTEHIICNRCNGTDFTEDITTAQQICNECGLIITKSLIVCSPEWKLYGDGGDAPRCSQTTDPLKPKTSTGIKLEFGGKIGRIAKWDVGSYEEKSLGEIYDTITFICEKYNINKVIIKDAHIMCRMISQKKYQYGKKKGKSIITRGKNREGIIASSVFFACKRAKEPRSTEEISKMFKITEKVLKNGAKNFYMFIKINNVKIDMGTTCVSDFIQRKCDELGIHQQDTQKIIKIANNIDKIDMVSTHTTYSIAAACILLAGKIYSIKSLTFEKVSLCFQISKVTINKTYCMIKYFKNMIKSDTNTTQFVNALNNKRNQPVISQSIYLRMKKFNIECDNKYIVIRDSINTNEKKIHNKIINSLIEKIKEEKLGTYKYLELAQNLLIEFSLYNDYLNRKIKFRF